jgi:hypothetical protein
MNLDVAHPSPTRAAVQLEYATIALAAVEALVALVSGLIAGDGARTTPRPLQ